MFLAAIRRTSLLLSIIVSAGLAASAADEVVFNRDIRPILSNHCYACHGPDSEQRQAEFRLDSKSDAYSDRGGYRPIVPHDPANSELYARIASDDPDEIMPPADFDKHLSPEHIDLIRRWIQQGAQWEEHWSFQPPRRFPLPSSPHTQFVRNEIDHFVLARLATEGLEPSPEAGRATLIRRVTFDLTGLPPTIEEIDAFLADESSDACERLVDGLLASPHYGEHMARHWLDLGRYSDTHGMHVDAERSMWLFRDWLIYAFNKNMPFDQFTIEQLAGDLLPNPTLDQLVATGFNRCNPSTDEAGSIAEEMRVRYAIDRVETIGTVWMGLSLNCAVCHDHKFDPIRQREFYQLFAYYANTDENPINGNALAPEPSVEVPTPRQKEQRLRLLAQIVGLEKNIREEIASVDYEESDGPKDAENSLLAWEESARAVEESSLPQGIQDALKTDRVERSAEQQDQLRDYFVEYAYAKTRTRFAALHEQLDAERQASIELEAAIPRTMIMREKESDLRDTFQLVRGEYDKPDETEKLHPNVPAVLPPLPESAPPNRLALSRWLVSPEHPLTARVIMNRFWQNYFGVGLVKTAEEFGAQGDWPTHPQLLDWLAVEFMESGWDIKHMHKLIVMSATYRQSSRVPAEYYRRDPENRLLARGPRFRLDAEMIRDQALAVSGLLVHTIGGRSVKPYQPAGVWQSVSSTGSNTGIFVQDQGDALYRRSIYTFWKRTSSPPTMSCFDAPSRNTCSARRERTNTPLQALVLLNDVQHVEAARHLAERIMTEGGSTPEARFTFVFRLATARRPVDAEVELLLADYAAHLAEFQRDAETALQLVDVGESSRNEELDISELAAWTMLAQLVLNLDETVSK
jgi:hypothetical protein